VSAPREHNDYWSNRRITDLEAEVERLREALRVEAANYKLLGYFNDERRILAALEASSEPRP
jgi:hypothetical protein